jgi:hypothetical protein
MSGSWQSADFPDLQEEHHKVTSPATREYNCIAWAAGDTENWWWPDAMGTAYWPLNVPREVTILAFQLAYGTLGFTPCNDSSLEIGFEKIALYALAGEPTHATRQLANGHWTSKLGDFEDIEHATIECLHGPCYGTVIIYMRRPLC